MTIEIFFDELAVLKSGDKRRLPLSSLDENSHIHGALHIKIQNRDVPQLGYWGANDVCFGDWVTELKNIRRALKGNVEGSYTFDEGEQGQPAFLFERSHDSMYLSVVDSEISDGRANKNWQRVEFEYKDFIAQYENFKDQFFATLQKEAPAKAQQWVERFLTNM